MFACSPSRLAKHGAGNMRLFAQLSGQIEKQRDEFWYLSSFLFVIQFEMPAHRMMPPTSRTYPFG